MNKKRKKYPSWLDFPDSHYGLGAPYVGMGIYTSDMKFSWPDPQCTTKEEHKRWMIAIREQGYAVPRLYLKAYTE